MNFSDAIGGIGQILDTPRRLLYQGGDAAARAMGYEGKQINGFGDVLGAAGMDEDSFLTQALGVAGNVATDPLTYVGGLGLFKGHKALQGMAAARGPKYAGGLEKLAAAGADGLGEGAAALEALKASPHAGRLMQELPEGAKFLGGNNGLAFQTPAGDVLRFGREESRLAIPEMLQPTRNVKVGDWRAERLPFAEGVGDRQLFAQNYKPMTESLRGQGLHPADMQPGNLGTVGGQPTLIDPGSVVPHPKALAAGQTFGRAAETAGSQGGAISDALLDYLGYTSSLRKGLGG